jgi:hypothetical protein
MTDQAAAPSDPNQIGLNERAHTVLKNLEADRFFQEMRHAYRAGVAYALAVGANPDRLEGARQTIYSISTIDPDGMLKLAIESLRGTSSESPYRVMERLADWGIVELDRLLREEYLSLDDILARIQGQTAES